VSMLPEVGQLSSLPPHDENRRRTAHRVPAGSSGPVVVAQPEFSEGGLQPLANDPTVAQLDLVDSGESVGTVAAQAVDQEDADAGKGLKGLACPLLDQMGRGEHQSRELPALTVNEDRGQGDQSLAGPAFSYHGSGTRPLPALNNTHHSH